MNLFKDDKGKTSMLRLMAFNGHIIGSLVMIVGATAAIMKIPAAGTIVTAGAGVFTACLGFKSLQKKQEHE
jgi:hypothetical protein